jgi:hypothetical protein
MEPSLTLATITVVNGTRSELAENSLPRVLMSGFIPEKEFISKIGNTRAKSVAMMPSMGNLYITKYKQSKISKFVEFYS